MSLPTKPTRKMIAYKITASKNTAAATDRLAAIAAAAIAAHPTAHHIRVRTNYGAYSAALVSFGEPLDPDELVWENDLLAGARLASRHDEEVSRLLTLASDRLNAVLDREIAGGEPVEVAVKVGDDWFDLSEVNETTEYEVEEIDLREINFHTTRPDYPSHMIDDAGMIYWVVAPGATNDAIADAFRAGYDGTPEPFDVTALASDERSEYTA